MKRLLFLWLAVLWAAVAGAVEPAALPPLTARVTDATGTLTSEEKGALEARLAELEARKGAQVTVLMLPTTQPETIEEFGIRLAEAWKIGRKGTDDGVIVIVAKDDRRMRIEVGYGLEGALNDATASRIINERMAPRFRQGDYAGGLRAGVEAIAAVVDGETLPPTRGRPAPDEGGDWLMWVFAALVFASFARRLFGGFGALMAAGAAGFFAFTTFGLIAALLVAALVFLLSFAPPGVFLGGRGGFGGGGGRGGFSGGGGGFGGGGASGRW